MTVTAVYCLLRALQEAQLVYSPIRHSSCAAQPAAVGQEDVSCALCDVMSCHVMPCHVMSCAARPAAVGQEDVSCALCDVMSGKRGPRCWA
jgi:hypothetical protein